jgi:ornithine carbamoyltransferase
MSARSLLDLWALRGADLRAILDEAARRKRARIGLPKGAPDADRPLDGRLLAMIFEKKSTRTRASFEVAMRQLGGASAVYNAADLQLGRGETIEDTARVLSGFFDAAMLRTNSHDTLEAFAAAAEMPVINGLTDQSHPCQILADLLTFEEQVGPLAGSRWAWAGDGNNVLASLLHAAPKLGFTVAAATPPAYRPKPADLARAEGCALLCETAAEAADGADVVVTDTWISMGDADEEERRAAFPAYQVTQALMARAAPRAIFLHCLPAHRGEEVEAAVIDGPRSAVFPAAENRLHAQKAALLWCFGRL